MIIKASKTKKLTLKMEFSFSDGKKQTVQKEGPKIVIGRGSKADAVVVHEEISRTHLQIELVDAGKVLLTDLGSANGSFIGDERMKPNEPVEYETFFMPIKLGKNIDLLMTIEEESA